MNFNNNNKFLSTDDIHNMLRKACCEVIRYNNAKYRHISQPYLELFSKVHAQTSLDELVSQPKVSN